MKFKLLFTVVLCFTFKGLIAQVTVSQSKLTIPTYQPAAAEKTPIFYAPEVYQNASLRVYPYPNINKLSKDRKSTRLNSSH